MQPTSDIVFLRDKTDSLEARLNRANANIDAQQSQIDDLENQCASHLEAISILAKALDEINQKLERLEPLEPLEDL